VGGIGKGVEEDRQVRKAFIYCRVSSPGQRSDARDGLPRQREAITKYAVANGIRVVEWFEDAITGKTDLLQSCESERSCQFGYEATSLPQNLKTIQCFLDGLPFFQGSATILGK
jgi:Resolvase, N terminal domain